MQAGLVFFFLAYFFTISLKDKFKEAIGFYEAIVKRHYDNVRVCVCYVEYVSIVQLASWHMLYVYIYMLFSKLLTVSAAVLANLCVSYVMTSQTDEVNCLAHNLITVHSKSLDLAFLSCSLCLCYDLFVVQAEDLMKKIEKEEVSVSFILHYVYSTIFCCHCCSSHLLQFNTSSSRKMCHTMILTRNSFTCALSIL